MNRFAWVVLASLLMAVGCKDKPENTPAPAGDKLVVAVVDAEAVAQRTRALEDIQKNNLAARVEAQRFLRNHQEPIEQNLLDLRKRAQDLLAQMPEADRGDQAKIRANAPLWNILRRVTYEQQKFQYCANAVQQQLNEYAVQQDRAFRDGIRPAIAMVAEESNVDAILLKGQALWVRQGIDLTDAVVHRIETSGGTISIPAPPTTWKWPAEDVAPFRED